MTTTGQRACTGATPLPAAAAKAGEAQARALRGGHACCSAGCAEGHEPVLIRERTGPGVNRLGGSGRGEPAPAA